MENKVITINYMRLVNRALIKQGFQNVVDVLKLTESYDLAIVLSSAGAYQPGPYIKTIHLKDDEGYNLNTFLRYIKELTKYLDCYQSVFPYTELEISIKYCISDSTDIKKISTHLISFYDKGTSYIKPINILETPILNITPNAQNRIEKILITDAANDLFHKAGVSHETEHIGQEQS